MECRIVNISASFNCGFPINLTEISEKVESTSYNKEKFNGLIMRVKSPKFTATLFPSGAIILTGCKSTEKTEEAAHKTVSILNNIGYDADVYSFKIQNIVGAGMFNKPINLQQVYEFLRNNIEEFGMKPSLEPEFFPALICKFKDSSFSCSLFCNGKFHVTGCKTEGDMFYIERNIIHLMHSIK